MPADQPVRFFAEDIQGKAAGRGFAKKGTGFSLGREVRDWWYVLADQGVVSAANFFAGVIIGRSCSKEELGLYMLGFSIVLLVTDLQVSLVSTPYTVYSPHVKGRSLRLYAGSSLIHEFALSLIMMTALTLCGTALSLGFGPPGLERVIWALVAAVTFVMLKEFVRRLCFADLRAGIALYFDACVALLQTGGLILLYRFDMLSASCAYWVIGCACGITGAGWLFLNKKAFLPRRGQAISDFGHNWKSSRWVFAGSLLWALSTNLYPWLLTFSYGAASAGVWAACAGIIAFVNVPFMGMQNLLGPKLANVYASEGTEALRRFTFKSSLLLFVVLGILCCVLFVIGDRLLVTLYGGKYTGNGLTIFILALGLVVAAVAFPFSRALYVIECAHLDFKINFIPFLIFLTFGLWLTQAFGPPGAAAGLALANLAASGARWATFVVLTRKSAEAAS